MRNRKLTILTVVLMIAPLVLAACGPTPEPVVIRETSVVVETVVVEKEGETVIQEATKIVEVEKVVTATPEPTPEGLSGTVVVWTSPMTGDDENPLYDELIRRFNLEYPDVEIQMEWVPFPDRDAKFSSALAADTLPDVAYVFPEAYLGWVADGVMEPLDDYISATSWNDVLPVWQDLCTEVIGKGAGVEPKIWMVPYLANGTSYIYNKDLFEQAGLDPEKPPSTWEELLDACDSLTQDTDQDGEIDQHCITFEARYNEFMPFWWQAGGNLLSDDLQSVRINDAAGLKAMNFMKTLVDNSYAPKELVGAAFGDMNPLWLDSKVAIRWFWAHEAPVQKNLVGDRFAFGYMPSLTDEVQRTFGSIGGWGMFSSSSNKEAAGAWIDFLMRPENISFWLQWVAAHGTQFSAATKSASEIVTLNDPVFNAVSADLAQHAYAHQLVPGYLEATDVLAVEIQRVLLEGKDPQEALDDAAKEIEELMQTYQ